MINSLDVNQYRKRLLLIVTISWLFFFIITEDRFQLLSDYSFFFLLGVFGALVANSTGAGGGIIFIPFFTALGLGSTEALGTSILIQCFGMTAGSISWLSTSHIVRCNSYHLKRLLFQILIISGISSIIGILAGQYLFVVDDASLMVTVFKIFSIVFGIILLFVVFYSHKQVHTRFDLANADIVLLIITCLIGGIITSWISVAIGELVALLLILRRYPTMVAIAMGVVVSSISVLTASYYHIVIVDSVNWSIIMFAAPGALLGGTLAYMVSEKLGPVRLKIFFSLWIIVTGLLM